MTLYRPLLLVSLLSLGLCACGGEEPSAPSAISSGGGVDSAPGSHAETRDQVPGGMPNFAPAESWAAYPPENKMRLANYRIPGVEGEGDAKVVVAAWPTNLGGLEANAVRWMGQTGIEGTFGDLSEEQMWEIKAGSFVATVFHLDAGQVAGAAESDAHGAKGLPLLVAYIEKPGSQPCWTVKVTGPSATINRNKDDFETFIKGL